MGGQDGGATGGVGGSTGGHAGDAGAGGAKGGQNGGAGNGGQATRCGTGGGGDAGTEDPVGTVDCRTGICGPGTFCAFEQLNGRVWVNHCVPLPTTCDSCDCEAAALSDYCPLKFPTSSLAGTPCSCVRIDAGAVPMAIECNSA